jgi:FkbM family methyltransferase
MRQRLAYAIKTLASKAIHPLLRKSAYFLNSKYRYYPSIISTLTYLKLCGFSPSTTIDVGAYVGNWTKMFKGIFPDSKVLMIEPLDDKSSILEHVCASYSGSVFLEKKLLGSIDGKDMSFVQMESGSSVFEKNSAFARTYQIKTQVSLDALLQSHSLFMAPSFLKLDVQGYELEVLKGATEVLKQTEFVLMEASLIPINRGSPLIFEVMDFMDKRGFRLLDFCSQIRKHDGALWQTDLLFIHEGSKYIPAPIYRA